MEISKIQLAAALDAILTDIGKADRELNNHYFMNVEWDKNTSEWYLELAYTKLQVLAEALRLPLLYAEIVGTFREARKELSASEPSPDGEPYLTWAFPARRFHTALQSIYLTESSQAVTKDLETLIRDSLYSITDPKIYGAPPANEADVHRRLHAIIRCIFPDALDKPPLAKPIKHFEPDTGIPSIRTVVEYKFISDAGQVGVIADQILADTQGYKSDKWRKFIYVIYETDRFRREGEWRQMLRECGNAENVTAIVLSGSSLGAKRKRILKSAGRPAKGLRSPIRKDPS